MKRILGLDIGTNSIGWALVLGSEGEDGSLQLNKIQAAGSRIIPMDAATLGSFNKGVSISQTAERTRIRSMRRLVERCHQRRERMHRVLHVLGFLPEHYDKALDRYGKIKEGEEPKLAWRKGEDHKYEFLFMDSFREMLCDFYRLHPEMAGKRIPLDWTIYYLRKKALTHKISKAELSWILLNFNQKRGYYQQREEEEETEKNKKVEYMALKVVSVENTGEKSGKDVWYDILLENGWIYRRSSKFPLDWVDKIKEFIVTTEINEDGTVKIDKDGKVKRSLRSPKEDDWTLIKERTQSDIETSGKTVGTYIYDYILNEPEQKVRGKLIRTIERKFYKDELKSILEKQTEFHPELQDKSLYNACVEELYSTNEAHRLNIANRNFTYLLVDDILFYQRPLKTKKSLISNCQYEEHLFIDHVEGKNKWYGVKCIAKSHPVFQEFRLWQFLSNLRIYKVGLAADTDVTAQFLKTEEDYVALFEWLNDKENINQKEFLQYPGFMLKKPVSGYRWNYIEDDKKYYPCNETRAKILSRLVKVGLSADFLTKGMEEALWHLLYSVKEKNILKKTLQSFADKHGLKDEWVDIFYKFPAFKREYGAYSIKAINKLLPLMRMGKYWSETDIDRHTRDRIEKMITGEYDEKIKERVREKAINLTDISHFRGLPLWLACYVVYDRHSETKEMVRWQKPEDLKKYLSTFKQHSLRNPIVEQVILETMRTVHDIWEKYGTIDEIHVELGREMKNPADKRAEMSKRMMDNEDTNLRIKALLTEFADPEFGIDNVRPFSPSQQDILRIYEEGVWDSVDTIPDDIAGIIKKFRESNADKRPTRSEVLRYKLWLEQKYCSPYTRQVIPLAKLFTPAYEIEHVIPKSRYFDDSFSNKVICESEVNKEKDKMLGFEFIKNKGGSIIELVQGKTVRILTEDEYVQFVKDTYGKNRTKMRKLLMEDIPDDFIERQLNDSRYISKQVKGLLSNMVREEGEEETTSKNVIVCTGGVTDRLKKDWGINDVWNRIILPRFIRLDEMMGKGMFTARSENGHLIPSMPLEFQKGFSKKRIDHRHHAMDAIVIACADRSMVNYLNNESARKKSEISRQGLQNLLCDKVKTDDKGNYKWVVKKPWNTYTQDVYDVLKSIIVSFKQNLRVINKTINKSVRFVNGKKKLVEQSTVNWSIRKPLHKDTLYGEVNLRKKKPVSLKDAIRNPSRIVDKELKKIVCMKLAEGYDLKRLKKFFQDNKDVWPEGQSKIEVYYFTKETEDRYFADREALDDTFTAKKIKDHVTDTGIQKILLRHLELNDNDPKMAFSPEGIDEMNWNIIQLNNGKFHHPIRKVRCCEKSNKFAVGTKGRKFTKFVEGAKGTNLYFAVYETEIINKKTGELMKKRSFATIPFKTVMTRQIQGLKSVPADVDGNEPIFTLSPGDLVYIPDNDGKVGHSLDTDRLYRMVSSKAYQCFFIKVNVATSIVDKVEFTSSNKMERAVTGEMIKEVCIPVKVDRLGNITQLG